ncbi:DUF2484 family protein [Tranquillimonas alkanivorans]|uniref:UDP-N-acetylmuramate--alanine ligase n=1 Tax=Tranquillimonas alkanivorans TaxID=441119 RepID=A0A1I5M049_9RHOB|nr:DUF2484 family protein [Tranquillimonas alkanivorans]SFP02840.1 Protein of unknown function [Tranquillimonas alkanivorans]
MSLPLLLACLWVFAAAVVALLPMRMQILPGLALLLAAPLFIGWIGQAHGTLPALAGTAAAVSMFRRPLLALLRRAVPGMGDAP